MKTSVQRVTAMGVTAHMDPCFTLISGWLIVFFKYLLFISRCYQQIRHTASTTELMKKELEEIWKEAIVASFKGEKDLRKP
jgi:hypothetical protein